MATRPIFIPIINHDDKSNHNFDNKFVNIRNVDIEWISGLALSHLQKNIKSLHEAAKKIQLWDFRNFK